MASNGPSGNGRLQNPRSIVPLSIPRYSVSSFDGSESSSAILGHVPMKRRITVGRTRALID